MRLSILEERTTMDNVRSVVFGDGGKVSLAGLAVLAVRLKLMIVMVDSEEATYDS